MLTDLFLLVLFVGGVLGVVLFAAVLAALIVEFIAGCLIAFVGLLIYGSVLAFTYLRRS